MAAILQQQQQQQRLPVVTSIDPTTTYQLIEVQQLPSLDPSSKQMADCWGIKSELMDQWNHGQLTTSSDAFLSHSFGNGSENSFEFLRNLDSTSFLPTTEQQCEPDSSVLNSSVISPQPNRLIESDLDAPLLNLESDPGPYDLQLRLEDREPATSSSFHQRLNAYGGSALWYAVGFSDSEKDMMSRALTAPEEKITKSIILKNPEVLPSLWCKELVPVRLFLHGRFCRLSPELRPRLIIRCSPFEQTSQSVIKECSICSDVKHRGGWYGADKRDTNSAKNIPDQIRHFWPSDPNVPTLHRNSLVILPGHNCVYKHDSRGRVYAELPLLEPSSSGASPPSAGAPLELNLYYTCMSTHGHDKQAPNSRDTFTSIQLEIFDPKIGRWYVQGRSLFRMRMVTSPERDILNEVTQFLTPADMGCLLGCGHLESHNTRWQLAKILRNYGVERLQHYRQKFGVQPGAEPTSLNSKIPSRSSTKRRKLNSAEPVAADTSSKCVFEVQRCDDSLVIRGPMMSNPETRELLAGLLENYLTALPLLMRSLSSNSDNSQLKVSTQLKPENDDSGRTSSNPSEICQTSFMSLPDLSAHQQLATDVTQTLPSVTQSSQFTTMDYSSPATRIIPQTSVGTHQQVTTGYPVYFVNQINTRPQFTTSTNNGIPTIQQQQQQQAMRPQVFAPQMVPVTFTAGHDQVDGALVSPSVNSTTSSSTTCSRETRRSTRLRKSRSLRCIENNNRKKPRPKTPTLFF